MPCGSRPSNKSNPPGASGAATERGEDLHAAVFDRGLVERDPHADDGRAERVIEIRVVLVPRLFAADARRLDERHVLKHVRLAVTEQAAHGGPELRVVREGLQARIELDEVGELAHGVLTLVGRERG